MIRPILNNKNKLFCEQYWEKVLKKDTKPKANTNLPYYFDITDINQMLVGCDAKMHNCICKFLETSPNLIIFYMDKAFKKFPQIKDRLTLWRGLREPDSDASVKVARFNKCYNAKAGDIIYMPEYAFASDSKEFAKGYSFSPNEKRAILYEIEVPEGAKIAHSNHFVFPRNSKFECIETNETIDKGIIYHNIKLRYIKPEHKEKEKTNFFESFISKINLF